MKTSIILFATKSFRRLSSVKTNAAMKQLEKYAVYNPVTLSLKDFVEFGTNDASSKNSFLFLRKELPVRLANIMKEINLLPDRLVSMPSVQVVESWYEQSFQEILTFEREDGDTDSVLRKFTEALVHIRNRHHDVVQTMAHGMIEMKEEYPDFNASVNQQTQYFLDRFYMSRIGIRMLINQHIMLFGPTLESHPDRHIGAIDPSCNILTVTKDAYANARFLCEQYYLTSPECEFIELNPDEKCKDILITYVPSHLYHMLFELFKNSMRAVVERHSEKPEVPPMTAMICKSSDDLTIKISDQGGGIPKAQTDYLFNYMYSTAPRPPSPSSASSTPLAGYGYGLPLARLYAKYFQGDLSLSSMHGYGTDALVYLKVHPRESNELLPVYNHTSRQCYNNTTPVGDWSDCSQTGTLHRVYQLQPSRLLSTRSDSSKSRSFSTSPPNGVTL